MMIANNEYSHQCFTSFVIPEGCQVIGREAFAYCTDLLSISIPESVIIIQARAFDHCINLVSVELPSRLLHIGNGAFQHCHRLANVVIPQSVRCIESLAFTNCLNLVRIELPDSLGVLNDGIFCNCRNLTSIQLPKTLQLICTNAFSGCAGIKHLVIPHDVVIQPKAFHWCEFQSISTNCIDLSVFLSSKKTLRHLLISTPGIDIIGFYNDRILEKQWKEQFPNALIEIQNQNSSDDILALLSLDRDNTNPVDFWNTIVTKNISEYLVV